MKKLCLLFAAVMTVVTVMLFSCGTDPMDRVSERRSGYFSATEGNYTVTAVSGVREDPYVSDGKVGSVKPYTLVTLVPKDFDIDAVYTYTAEIKGSTYGGALNVHPFAASFSAEFDAEATEDFVVKIKRGTDTVALTLHSAVAKDTITFDRAIDAAKTALKPSGNYEIRARIIKNPFGDDGMCWHVLFYTGSGESSVLLDPTTAKVLAKKN